MGNNMALEDRFEILKEIGDGSFGNVVLARVRTAGANIARRGTVVSCFCVAFRSLSLGVDSHLVQFRLPSSR